MAMTFGQRLKAFRKNEGWTQQDLADMIDVSTQAISKWETDAGMPDISQIVPLSRVLNISTDILLGVVDDNDTKEFEKIYQKCMKIETLSPCKWPPEATEAEKGFRLMYDYFCTHPTNPKAAKYLLDMAELYFGKFDIFDEATTIKECERFANCIFRFSEDADLLAEARFLIASVYMRIGQKEKANNVLSKMPFKYGDRAYFSAEVAKLGGDYASVEKFCKQSFTYRARFLIKSISLVASLPNKTIQEQIELEEYMLRIINALLSNGDYLPFNQIYQKLRLLCGLISKHLRLENEARAVECFEELIESSKAYLEFASNGSKDSCLMLNDDGLERYSKADRLKYQKEMLKDCLGIIVNECKDCRSEVFQNPLDKILNLLK
ncbi:MAG: helix-turn-helix transcriptional regulator [Clostridia bacterium]|nr:helix-turn-helix transcriptional regulator [Clostridia bacterium]